MKRSVLTFRTSISTTCDLCHTYATMLGSNSVRPKIVQEMLGHSQISLTLDTYSHVLSTMQEEAADTLKRILTGTRGT